jgi:hypothetical protein
MPDEEEIEMRRIWHAGQLVECHRTIDIGPDAFLFSAEIIEKADNPYVRVALEIGLYGTGTH